MFYWLEERKKKCQGLRIEYFFIILKTKCYINPWLHFWHVALNSYYWVWHWFNPQWKENFWPVYKNGANPEQ